MNKYDIDDTKNIVRLLNTFTHGKHSCLVFEKLQDDLYSILKKRHFKPFSLTIIKSITYQLMNTLVYLADKNVNIIHCDIKPENILLQKDHQASVKLIDFGSSCSSSKTMYTYIQSRYYRSPEILLGLHYNTQIDIWSLGCVMAELFTGNPLFPGTSSQDQMSRIYIILELFLFIYFSSFLSSFLFSLLLFLFLSFYKSCLYFFSMFIYFVIYI